LDLFFLTIGFLGYAFKYLDQTNIVSKVLMHAMNLDFNTLQSNAYVSGMQTDLKLYGNELNYFTTYFKYACSIPSDYLKTYLLDLY
jgi:hypothetical protein